MAFEPLKEYPLIVARDAVIFPKMVLSMIFKRPRSQAAVREALGKGRMAVVVLQKKKLKQDPMPENLYSVGTLIKILEIHRLPDEAITAVVEGRGRVKIEKFTKFDPFIRVKVKEVVEVQRLTTEGEALMHTVEEHFKKAVALGMSIPLETLSIIFARSAPSEKVDLIAFSLNLHPYDKQKVLEAFNLRDRLEIIYDFLSHKLEVLQVAKRIKRKTAKELGKVQKEVILREQLKAIQAELGMGERSDIAELRKKINEAGMPKEAKKIAKKELGRLESIPAFSPEISYIRNYLDWLADLPWAKKSEAKLDVAQAKKILDEDHYGLDDVKERMLEYIAVCKLAKKIKGPILCFVGPPGTGKTSVGKSIARALGRKFVRMSLGGIRDEAEIRGHRRTYVGALPGRIIQGIKTAGTKNPVFMLDEIDKVGADFRGDPSAALLEALDPEQNFSFSDHYIEIPFDLSDVMFITTANILDPIPPALKDRMEVVEFPGYTEEEKFHIARGFIVPKLIKSHGLDEKRFRLTDEAVRDIIRQYTREAGVRDLEREIAKVCRRVARKITEKPKETKKVQVVGPKDLHGYLGPAQFQLILAEKKDEVGVATALAWTQAGGEILFVEATKMPGKGKLILTGHLGDIMKESAQAAFSYARSRAKKLGIKDDFYKLDLHVHVPAGAIPKDGPSAGIAMAATLISALTKKKIRREVGMTGEMTLRGKVLKIGGVKEKVLAAHRAGLKKVILPADNKKDLEKLPDKVKKDLKFLFVKQMDEVLKMALK